MTSTPRPASAPAHAFPSVFPRFDGGYDATVARVDADGIVRHESRPATDAPAHDAPTYPPMTALVATFTTTALRELNALPLSPVASAAVRDELFYRDDVARTTTGPVFGPIAR